MNDSLRIYAGIVLFYESCVYIWFLDQLIIRRFHRWITILLVFALQLIFYGIFNDTLKFGIELLCDLFIIFLCYRGNPIQNGIYTIIFYAFMFLCDTICALLFYLLSGAAFNIIENVTYLQIIISVASRIMLPFLIKPFIKLHPKELLTCFHLYPITIVIAGIQFFFSPFADTLYYTNPKWLYVLVVIFMYACMLYIILMLREKNKQSEYLHKLQIMDIHNAGQVQYIKEILYSYKNLSKNIHDMRHHLDLLNSYITTNRCNIAQDYLLNLYSELSNVVINYTGNADVDSIIYSKQMIFPDVKFNVNGLLPESILWLKTVDLCTLLSNALENAAQACESISGSVIDVEFLYRDWLIITIINPYSIPPVKKNGQYISSRRGDYGLGIKSMREITQIYNGYLLIEDTAGKFKLDILLQKRNH